MEICSVLEERWCTVGDVADEDDLAGWCAVGGRHFRYGDRKVVGGVGGALWTGAGIVFDGLDSELM